MGLFGLTPAGATTTAPGMIELAGDLGGSYTTPVVKNMFVLKSWTRNRRTAGNVQVTSTSWANVDTATDITFSNVNVGDIIEASLSTMWTPATNTTAYGILDVATIVSGSPVNYFGASGGVSDFGVSGWIGAPNLISPVSGSISYVVQAGDLSAGSITLRLRCRVDVASSNHKDLFAVAADPLQFECKWYKAQ
jgi:hypothetical protein